MDTTKKAKIDELTKQRKKIEKQLKKNRRKRAVFEFFTYYDRLGIRVSKGALLATLIFGGFGIGVLVVTNPILAYAMGGVALSTLLVAGANHGYFNFVTKDKLETQHKELKQAHDEVLKHLDCVRSDKEYVAPEPPKDPFAEIYKIWVEVARERAEKCPSCLSCAFAFIRFDSCRFEIRFARLGFGCGALSRGA